MTNVLVFLLVVAIVLLIFFALEIADRDDEPIRHPADRELFDLYRDEYLPTWDVETCLDFARISFDLEQGGTVSTQRLDFYRRLAREKENVLGRSVRRAVVSGRLRGAVELPKIVR